MQLWTTQVSSQSLFTTYPPPLPINPIVLVLFMFLSVSNFLWWHMKHLHFVFLPGCVASSVQDLMIIGPLILFQHFYSSFAPRSPPEKPLSRYSFSYHTKIKYILFRSKWTRNPREISLHFKWKLEGWIPSTFEGTIDQSYISILWTIKTRIGHYKIVDNFYYKKSLSHQIL
jgi:hypothetical protein